MTDELEKSKEQREAERLAEEAERTIVRFTNIDNESFTHAFRGVSITVRSGESYVCRMPEGHHLATHLARKMISRQKKKQWQERKEEGGNLFTDKEVEEWKKKIITEVDKEAPKVSVADARKADIERLNTEYKEAKPDEEVVTKKDIIDELKKRGQKPNVLLSKAELLQQLMDLEAQGK